MFFGSSKEDNPSLVKKIYLENIPAEGRSEIICLLSQHGYIGNLQKTDTFVSMVTNGEIELGGTQYYLFSIPKQNPLYLQFNFKEKTLIHILNHSPANKKRGRSTHYHTIAKIDGQRLNFNEKALVKMRGSDPCWEPKTSLSAIFDVDPEPKPKPGCVLS